MVKDFYLNDRALAAYFEKDWFDHVLLSETSKKPRFHFSPFDPEILYSNYHAQLANFLNAEIEKQGNRPTQMLEIGSSLGRTFYEICCKIKSLKSATLVEPSQNLCDGFKKIFEGSETAQFSVLKGNVELTEVSLNTAPIRAACSSLTVKCFQSPFQKLKLDSQEQFDLVICSNVIDQCMDHLQLVDLLKKTTKPGGILLVSCTYQWQEKYIGNADRQIKNINDLFFGTDWNFLNETNIPFQVRAYERHWLTFLSHVAVFQKNGVAHG